MGAAGAADAGASAAGAPVERSPHGDQRDLLPAANRAYLRRRGIAVVIPVKEDQKNNRRARGRRGGRPPAFDATRYRDRNTVERCFNKLKQFRAVATRYDKRKQIYQGTLGAASASGYATQSHDLQTRPAGLMGARPCGKRPTLTHLAVASK